MVQSSFAKFPRWSAEYVIAHAQWRRQRGRRPSMAYRGIGNPIKALALAEKMLQDYQFEDTIITDVDVDFFTTRDIWSFCIQKEWGIIPKIGDIARFYGAGIGYSVRGLDINGQVCYYRTEEEQKAYNAEEITHFEAEEKAEFEKNKASLDQKYQKLPKVFQQRIDRFRNNNPDFRWEYESYEMFCCEQAIFIAKSVAKRLKIAASKKHLTVSEFVKFRPDIKKLILKKLHDMSCEKQLTTIRGLSRDHSGNTLGFSFTLATLYLSQQPKNVIKFHGSLSPLVGSEEYGDYPRKETLIS